MKKVKILTIAFISTLGILLIPKGVDAAYVDMTYEIYHNSDTSTYKVNKTVEGIQKIKVTDAYTPITVPCPKCLIEFKPYREGFGKTEGKTLQLGQTKELPATTSNYVGKYHLVIRRQDITLLPTTVSFRWTYQ